MEEPILFNPDNRLLGSAAGDLGSYGAQSDERFSVHEARDDAANTAIPAGGANVATAPDTSDLIAEVTPLPQTDAAVPAQADSGSGLPSANSFLIATAVPELSPVQPIGSGDTAGLVQSVAVPAAQGSGAPVPALDAAGDAASPVSEAASAPAIADAPIMGTAASLIDTLADGPAPVPIAASAAGSDTALVTAPASELAEGVAASVTDAVGGIVVTTVALADDALEGLAGSDPLAGVETLVSMVSNSDTFDLAPVVAPLLETVSDTGLHLVDTLVGEEAPFETLLGSNQHEGGLLGLDHHDNPLGL